MTKSSLKISKSECEKRRNRLLDTIREKEMDAICLFDPESIFYLTNFGFLQTERPMALILTTENDVYMFIPALEKDRIKEVGYVEEKRTYPDYPGKRHPLTYLKDLFEELNLEDKTIGVDAKAPPSTMGYTGPNLEKLLPSSVIKNGVGDIIQKMRLIKSDNEVQLIEESAKWARKVHKRLQKITGIGKNETLVSQKASMKTSMKMIQTLGKQYRAYKSDTGATAGFRGQVGTHSAIPHSVTINAKIKKRDVLVTGATANIGEYKSELERTMIVGSPTEKQRKYFNLMKKAQEIAFDRIEAGVKCSQVDKAVREFYKENDIMKYWRHHTGHGIGLGVHEPPFFDIGDHTRLQAGMVMTVEPGIYIPGFAGFRHSDTVLVTEEGIQRITEYPRDLEKLTIPT